VVIGLDIPEGKIRKAEPICPLVENSFSQTLAYIGVQEFASPLALSSRG